MSHVVRGCAQLDGRRGTSRDVEPQIATSRVVRGCAHFSEKYESPYPDAEMEKCHNSETVYAETNDDGDTT